MPEVDWQLSNLGQWDINLRLAIHSLLALPDAARDENVELCGAIDSVRELFRVFGHFRPKRTTALREFGALIDERTRSQQGIYCELCWRQTIRSKRLEELASMPLNEAGRLRGSERIVAGNLSGRYCMVHKPGSAKYHADLRYKKAFHHHLAVLLGSERSHYAFNFHLPDAADIQEVRKTAYDQVHSRLHAIAPAGQQAVGLREKIWVMHREGISQAEMARRLGVSRQAISKAWKSLSSLVDARQAGSYIDPVTGEVPFSATTYAAVRDALRSGLSFAETAKAVGLDNGTLDSLLRAAAGR